jgi:hypothetical protein
MKVSNTRQNPTANGYETNRWSLRTKILIGSAAVTVLALATIKAMSLYTHYQNGNIKTHDCKFGENVDGVLKDFKYYKNAAESGKATDQYCFAKMHETGIGTVKNLSEARNWYKKAAEQGLELAGDDLCQPHMFEYQYGNFEEFKAHQGSFIGYESQFINICCRRPPCGTTCLPPRCPWENENSTFIYIG